MLIKLLEDKRFSPNGKKVINGKKGEKHEVSEKQSKVFIGAKIAESTTADKPAKK